MFPPSAIIELRTLSRRTKVRPLLFVEKATPQRGEQNTQGCDHVRSPFWFEKQSHVT